ncbi:NifB/NifX family molybdenum-iron cluster-binding protein [Desulfovibrio sp. JC010]|uniref:NifB/NifX family molybdenum-iron cluster-binding protein n=1 Tax=Desulfovibrio sp. JC010 TaxID=2593641 RepID=UPI0013D1404E|nr:NifB/NifX family molybdenum-iron cluster-binding protein [Desulfovibrio sp. JC010]NDV27398.1 dinitrogenase iron-molybdenum cofactor biosynthesis protein [Desulfovibrio sp. JC010]
MLIAVSANNSNADSPLEPRFGRAAGFIIFDSETEEFRFVDNGGNSQLAQGAGIQTAQMLAEQGVGAVISGTFGPKAEAALQQGGIQMVTASGTVREAVNVFGGSEQAATATSMNNQQPGAGMGIGSGRGMGGGCRRMGGTGRGMGMANGGRGMGGGGRGMGGRGMGGGGMGRRS